MVPAGCCGGSAVTTEMPSLHCREGQAVGLLRRICCYARNASCRLLLVRVIWMVPADFLRGISRLFKEGEVGSNRKKETPLREVSINCGGIPFGSEKAPTAAGSAADYRFSLAAIA